MSACTNGAARVQCIPRLCRRIDVVACLTSDVWVVLYLLHHIHRSSPHGVANMLKALYRHAGAVVGPEPANSQHQSKSPARSMCHVLKQSPPMQLSVVR